VNSGASVKVSGRSRAAFQSISQSIPVRILAGAVLSMALAASPAHAQNLILNPGFETNGCGSAPGQCQTVSNWVIASAVDITSGIGNGGGNGSPWALNPYGNSTTTQTVVLGTAGAYNFLFFTV
jgi:hypothetical protein